MYLLYAHRIGDGVHQLLFRRVIKQNRPRRAVLLWRLVDVLGWGREGDRHQHHQTEIYHTMFGKCKRSRCTGDVAVLQVFAVEVALAPFEKRELPRVLLKLVARGKV
jgi:hypothetical protein